MTNLTLCLCPAIGRTGNFFWTKLCLLVLLSLSVAVPVVWAEPIWVDDRDSAVIYNGNWTVQKDRNELYKEGDTWSETPGSTLSFTFYGSAIEYWGTQGPRNGGCSITVDGAERSKITAYSVNTVSPSIMLFRFTEDEAHTLDPVGVADSNQNHTIVVGVTYDDQPNGARCELDYFVFLPHSSTGETFDDTHTAAQNASDQTDRIQSIVLSAVLVPTILAFLAWGVWRWYKYRTSETRRELLDQREIIRHLRNRPFSPNPEPQRFDEVVPRPQMVQVLPPEVLAPSPSPELGGLNMAGVGAGATSLPNRMGDHIDANQPRFNRSATAPALHRGGGRGVARPVGGRPVPPRRPSGTPASTPRFALNARGSGPSRTSVTTPGRREMGSPLTMDAVTENGVLVDRVTTAAFREGDVQNDPNLASGHRTQPSPFAEEGSNAGRRRPVDYSGLVEAAGVQ